MATFNGYPRRVGVSQRGTITGYDDTEISERIDSLEFTVTYNLDFETADIESDIDLLQSDMGSLAQTYAGIEQRVSAAETTINTVSRFRSFANRNEYLTAVNGSNPPKDNDTVMIRSDSGYGGVPTIGTGAQYVADSGITPFGNNITLSFTTPPSLPDPVTVGDVMAITAGVTNEASTIEVTTFTVDGVDKLSELSGLNWDSTGENVYGVDGDIFVEVTATSASGSVTASAASTLRWYPNRVGQATITPDVDGFTINSVTEPDDGNDPITKYQYRIDGGAAVDIPSFPHFVSATAGTREIGIRAVNGVGNGAFLLQDIEVLAAPAGNVAPVASDFTISMDENTTRPINMVASSNDADGDSLTLSGTPVITSGGGTISNVTSTSIDYTPDTDYTGNVSISFTITDGTDTDDGVATVVVLSDTIPAMQAGMANLSGETHTVVQDGNWSNADTWDNGVPTAGSRIYVPAGRTLNYDLMANADVEWVNVHGNMIFKNNSSLEIQTLQGVMGSYIEMGTAASPITCTVTFKDTPIASYDTDEAGNGLVTMGMIEMNGAHRESYVYTNGVAQGTNTITIPANDWQIGDRVLIPGIGLGDGQSETMLIQDIDGDTVTLNGSTLHNHVPPQPTSLPASHPLQGFVMRLPVANLSRSIILRSENGSSSTTRGHVMIMTPDTMARNVRNVRFEDMGRTDKSLPLSNSNRPGRYPLHLHLNGSDASSVRANLYGNVIVRSIGWAITQHGSAANVDHNVVYDISGAGIVSETGDEVGQWVHNLVDKVAIAQTHTNAGSEIGSQSTGAFSGEANFGVEGECYHSQSRLLIMQDNIASNAEFGWRFRARNDGLHIPHDRSAEIRDNMPFKVRKKDHHEEPWLQDFFRNYTFAVDTVMNSAHRQHVAIPSDLMSVFEEMHAFNVWVYFSITPNYSHNYLWKDCIVLGEGNRAMGFGDKMLKMQLHNVHFEDFNHVIFDQGVNQGGFYVDVTLPGGDEIIDPTSTGVSNYDASYTDANRAQSSSEFTFVAEPSLNITRITTPGSDGSYIEVEGSFTDSAGTSPLGYARWASTAGHDFDFIRTNHTVMDNTTAADLVAEWGVVNNGGTWTTRVYLWISDRLTGVHKAFPVDINMSNLNTSTLSAAQISNFPSAPSGVVTIQNSSGV